jgi:hypothetical protein
MNRITEITRRDIIDLFRHGYIESYWTVADQRITYIYHGRLSEIEFLKKLYPLDEMQPSFDTRCKNAGDEIWRHTIANDDWDSDWVFEDDRFELLRGNDDVLLRFLCAVFHPENRNETGNWHSFLTKINILIRTDGYELYDNGEKISGRSVYVWRKLTPEEIASGGRFLPFSLRHKKALDDRSITIPTISKKTRKDLVSLFNRYNDSIDRTTETNWHYSVDRKDAAIADIKEYYVPKSFDSDKKYNETNDLEQFVINNYPCYVLDAIEMVARCDCPDTFASEVNLLFQNAGLAFRLLGGKIEMSQMRLQTNEVIREVGLKELVGQATTLYYSSNISDKQIAVEKLWDAFERLKTYYGDKKTSADKIIADMANGNDHYSKLLHEEFRVLTAIGNEYRIRHHETDKIEITDTNYHTYFFQRCFALIDLALKYLK